MREALPFLKLAPRGGRVVVTASKNVPAPGPKAAAYSASKAALTQLARVAALEWGEHGIRVNVVHPNAVFDTAIWSTEVIESRAASYGLTVAEYKANNVLGVEVTSRHVAQMIAEMCGPTFARTTGAQSPGRRRQRKSDLRTSPAREVEETDVLSDLVDRIFETTFPARPNEPSLQGYYGDLRDPRALEEYVRYHDDLLRFANFDPNGTNVLDVGSGFGLVLVWLASRGAYAHGLEIVPWMVDDVHMYLTRLPTEIQDRVTDRQGSASQIPYGDSSFDLVLAIEAVSHYLDYAHFLTEAHRVLRPGGKLLIIDGNNGLNPMIRRHCKHIWALHERDMVDDEDPWLFVPKRQRIIEENFPQLDATDAHALALRTAGLVRGQIIESVCSVSGDGRTTWQRVRVRAAFGSPGTEEIVMERLFNPYALGRELHSHGFDVTIQGYWGGASGSPFLRSANRVLATLSPLDYGDRPLVPDRCRKARAELGLVGRRARHDRLVSGTRARRLGGRGAEQLILCKLVDGESPLGHAFDRVLGEHATPRGFAQPPTKRLVAHERLHSVHERWNVTGRNQHPIFAGLVDHLGDSADSRSDDRTGACHRLRKDERRGLLTLRWEEKHVGRGEVQRHGLVGLSPGKGHPRVYSEPAGERLEGPPLLTVPDDHELRALHPTVDERKRLDCVVDSLVAAQAADADE